MAQLPLYQGAQTPRCYRGSSRRPAEKSNRRPAVSGTWKWGGNRDPLMKGIVLDPWILQDTFHFLSTDYLDVHGSDRN